MNFKISKNGIEESFWNSIEKITTPSLAVSKNGSKYYIPLFETSSSEITYGDYIYTLSSRFKIGSKKPALSRVIANHSPDVQILSYPSGISGGVIGSTNSLTFTVTDIDNDPLTVKIMYTQNAPTSGQAHAFTEADLKTYENVSSGTTISFSGYVPESGANGYSNAGDYILRVKVTDSKGVSVSSGYINIYKNADLFESTVFWVDYNTRYLGTYSDNGSTITITEKTGNGVPYQQFCGFDPSLEGKSLTWDVVSKGYSIKSRWVQNCSNIVDNPVITNNIRGNNIDDTVPENHYGVKICEGWVPNGEYDLIFTVIDGDVTYKYYLHIIMDVPNNPGGTLWV
jgi:hypothetical protein